MCIEINAFTLQYTSQCIQKPVKQLSQQKPKMYLSAQSYG